jgi:hypothetical protein
MESLNDFELVRLDLFDFVPYLILLFISHCFLKISETYFDLDVTPSVLIDLGKV